MSKSTVLLRRTLAFAFLITVSLTAAGCGTGWFSAVESDTSKETAPEVPPIPVVVDGVRTSYADVVAKTTPAVVQITARKRATPDDRASGTPFDDLFPFPDSPRGGPAPSTGLGSGVLVKDDGTILTNHHVIEDSERISVEMNDGRTFDAKIVGSDPPSDLAVLKIEQEGLPFLKLGDSDQVRIGDIVLAIGNPLGIGQTVTSGIISAKSRRTGLSDGTSFQDFLQTDAPINQGNSGGALVNVNGELIGINSQILSRTGGNIGIGFAIPSNMAKSVMDQLIETGEVRRGMLGINIQDITSDLAEGLGLESTNGVVISNVQSGSAADSAGLKRGDIIRKINGEEVEDGNFLRNKVAATLPGTTVQLLILRDGQEREVSVKLGEYEARQASSERNSGNEGENGSSGNGGRLGITLQPLTPQAAERLEVPRGVRGLVVAEVDPAGPAAEKGLRRGDVVVEINRELVTSLEEARSAIASSGDKAVLLLISRGGQTFFVSVKPS